MLLLTESSRIDTEFLEIVARLGAQMPVTAKTTPFSDGDDAPRRYEDIEPLEEEDGVEIGDAEWP
ncbi:hypothetical protein ACFO4E_19470 [Nocardiopsis mangrovi]|uniref:Uncharacterized protein n=1 Tax=Nocardiopsis mangrovi TaxID=1179818 RepID=A0ABV9DZA3_9ACTN